MVPEENMVVADKFRLVKMIGRGGMGSVWRAQHLGLDTPCAVKFIEGQLANAAEAHARFEREAKAAAQLRSSHVVQIFDHGVWQGTPYIAMELLEGENLGERLASRGGMLPPSDVISIMQQVCRALAKAHGNGVVHRDLKPDNIYLVKEDDREIVKILDFGVAKHASHAIEGSNTKTGAMLGTPYYMSPEQAQGVKSVDARSDLWSLAVIVFQCLTGRLPFESEALGDLLVKIIVHPIPSTTQFAPHLPPTFEAWWRRAAERNVDARIQTAREFAESLQAALGGMSDSEWSSRNVKVGGATAVMNPGSVANYAPNTPQPGALQMPSQNVSQGGTFAIPTPAATTGSPVAGTFPGLEGAAAQKKGVPAAVFIAIAALGFVGLVLGGFALLKGGKSTAAGGSGPASTETATSTAVATATATAPATATATASATAAPADTAAATATAAPSASVAQAASTVRRAPTGGGTKPAAHPTATAAATATAKPAPKKGVDLGF